MGRTPAGLINPLMFCSLKAQRPLRQRLRVRMQGCKIPPWLDVGAEGNTCAWTTYRFCFWNDGEPYLLYEINNRPLGPFVRTPFAPAQTTVDQYDEQP